MVDREPSGRRRAEQARLHDRAHPGRESPGGPNGQCVRARVERNEPDGAAVRGRRGRGPASPPSLRGGLTLQPLLAAVAFVPGLAVGSFLNVVAARVPEGRSIVKPRSACGNCGATIACLRQRPAVSATAYSAGRCRNCGVQIGLIYPAVELTAAALIAACLLAFGATLRRARRRVLLHRSRHRLGAPTSCGG